MGSHSADAGSTRCRSEFAIAMDRRDARWPLDRPHRLRQRERNQLGRLARTSRWDDEILLAAIRVRHRRAVWSIRQLLLPLHSTGLLVVGMQIELARGNAGTIRSYLHLVDEQQCPGCKRSA